MEILIKFVLITIILVVVVMIMLTYILVVIMNVVVMTMVLVVLAAKCAGFTLAYLGLKPGLEAHTASPTLALLLPAHCSTLQCTAGSHITPVPCFEQPTSPHSPPTLQSTSNVCNGIVHITT